MENLALADVTNTHTSFPFYVAESEDKSETFCFNCRNYELV